MKRKTIAKILKKKFFEWTDSIDDEELRKQVNDNSIITGGSIASMLLNEPVNDIDVYFKNKETAEAVARYYVENFNESGPLADLNAEVMVGKGRRTDSDDSRTYYKAEYEDDRVWICIPSDGVAGEAEPGYTGEQLGDDEDIIEYIDEPSLAETAADLADEKPPFEPVFLSANAITLRGRIQLIIRFHGDAEKIHTNYDFVHCTNHWDSKTCRVILREAALEAILTRELRYVGSKYPVCSIIRTRKFVRRGWSITAGQYLKMVMQCNDMDLYNLDTLEDQLVGVDSAYFMQVISMIRSEKLGEGIDSAYICEIIDRIF